jgi:DNA polymerase III subunit gamma/tau
VIEIDAATNRGIDEIRELRDAARYRPSRDKYKIYILDEAHQITDAAFNALLKTLEEPPDHIVFMMATTQPEDIPQTIRSRCQHFSFHAVKLDDIVGQLRHIATAEAITANDATLALLAEAGDGSMRDALSIMDQAIASAPTVSGHPALDADQIRELMGSVSNVVYEQILDAVHANDSAAVLGVVGKLLDAGNGAPQLARQFVRYLRNTIVAKITSLAPDAEATGIAADLLQISPEERHRAARSAALFTEEELSRFLSIMLRTFDELGYRQEQRFHLELGLLKLVHMQRLVPVEELLSQLGAKHSSTSAPRPTATPATPRTTATAPAPPTVAPPSPPKMTMTAGSLALASDSEPLAAPTATGPQLVVTQPAVTATLDLNALHSACVTALAAVKGQTSASEQMEDSTFALDGDILAIQTTLSAQMLTVVLNAEAAAHPAVHAARSRSGTQVQAAPRRSRTGDRCAEEAAARRRLRLRRRTRAEASARPAGYADILCRDQQRHRPARQGVAAMATRFAAPMARLIDELRKLPGVGTKSPPSATPSTSCAPPTRTRPRSPPPSPQAQAAPPALLGLQQHHGR